MCSRRNFTFSVRLLVLSALFLCSFCVDAKDLIYPKGLPAGTENCFQIGDDDDHLHIFSGPTKCAKHFNATFSVKVPGNLKFNLTFFDKNSTEVEYTFGDCFLKFERIDGDSSLGIFGAGFEQCYWENSNDTKCTSGVSLKASNGSEVGLAKNGELYIVPAEKLGDNDYHYVHKKCNPFNFTNGKLFFKQTTNGGNSDIALILKSAGSADIELLEIVADPVVPASNVTIPDSTSLPPNTSTQDSSTSTLPSTTDLSSSATESSSSAPTSTLPSSKTTLAPVVKTTKASTKGHEDESDNALVIGLVVGGIGVVLLLSSAGVGIWCWRSKKAQKKEAEEQSKKRLMGIDAYQQEIENAKKPAYKPGEQIPGGPPPGPKGWEPDHLQAKQFKHLGPLRITIDEPVVMEHALENEYSNRKLDQPIVWDDESNQVWDIGTEVEELYTRDGVKKSPARRAPQQQQQRVEKDLRVIRED